MTNKKNDEFKEILEHGAEVDSIFKADEEPLIVPLEVTISPRSQVFSSESLLPSTTESVNENNQSSHTDVLPVDDDVAPIAMDESLVVIQKKLYGIETLFDFVNSNGSFGEMISGILSVFAQQVRSEAASFFEYDYDNDCYFFRAVSGKSSKSLLKVTVPKGAGIVGRVAETQKPVIMSRMEDSSIHLKSIGSLIGFEAKDVVAIPIVVRGHTFGVVELLNPTNTKIYTDSDFEILESLGRYAAKVVENRLILAAYGEEFEKFNGKKAA